MVRTQNKPKANPHIGELSFLKRKPNPERAHDLLQDLTKSVSYLMLKNSLKVKALAEFYPRDKNLLGLNVNHGLKIMIRLRSPNNDAEFLSWESILETMIHELTHNRFGVHDSKFYEQYEDFRLQQWSSERLGLHDNFLGSGRRLGGSPNRGGRSGSHVLGKRFTGRGTKLGYGSNDRINDGRRLTPKEMAALAASRRKINDESKLCHDANVNVEQILENHSQMESQVEFTVIPDSDEEDMNEHGNIDDDGPKEGDSSRDPEIIDLT